jgi:hypothetical protein
VGLRISAVVDMGRVRLILVMNSFPHILRHAQSPGSLLDTLFAHKGWPKNGGEKCRMVQ